MSEKRNRFNVYLGVIKEWFGSIQIGGIGTFCLLRYCDILTSKFIKILNYNFMINCLKLDNFLCLKCFNTSTKI